MAAATVPLPKIALGSADPTDIPRKHKQCVLLIEDDEDAMHWVQHALKEYGNGKYKLEWKECLSDGLSRLLNGGIDLILLDLGLGDCSSPFTETWVRKAAPRVPIVVLSGDPAGQIESSLPSIEKHLVKGHVSPAGLVQAISDALDAGMSLKKSSQPG
jgi:DNA-binding NarL/FixJ family response regulator